MKTKVFIFFAVIFLIHSNMTIHGQSVVVTDDDSYVVDGSAMLDVKSTEKGLLIPRMTTSERENISSPATGLMVFQTDNTIGFYYYNGSEWKMIGETGTQSAWGLTGNAGTNASNFVGTSDNQPLYLGTNNLAKLKITSLGQIEPLNTGSSLFIGEYAGAFDDLTDNYNIFIGYSSGYSNYSGDNNIFLGQYAGYKNTTGANNTCIGNQAGFNGQTISNNTFIGANAGSYTTGAGNIAVGFSANATSNTYTNTVVVGTGISPTASNQVRLGNGSTSTFFCQGAYVARTGGTYQALSIWSDGQIAYLSSSRRYKNNITNMENVDWLYNLRPVNFLYNSDSTSTKQYGLIAEEVEAINKKFVFYKDELVEGVNYTDLISPMLKAIQDQKKANDALQSQVEQLQMQIENLNAKIEKINNDLSVSAKK